MGNSVSDLCRIFGSSCDASESPVQVVIELNRRYFRSLSCVGFVSEIFVANKRPASSHPPHPHEPRLWPALAEADVLQIGPDLESCRLDGFDLPAIGERFFDLSP
jgi:hypothetical protein